MIKNILDEGIINELYAFIDMFELLLTIISVFAGIVMLSPSLGILPEFQLEESCQNEYSVFPDISETTNSLFSADTIWPFIVGDCDK